MTADYYHSSGTYAGTAELPRYSLAPHAQYFAPIQALTEDPMARYLAPLKGDSPLLNKLFEPVHISQNDSVADQVFGQQLAHQQLSLKHALSLLEERTKLHYRHKDEIERRHLHVQEELFGAQLHAKMDNHQREMRVERVLLQLDEERRKEELDFWKDTAEIRGTIIEEAKAYQALRHRLALLGEGPAYVSGMDTDIDDAYDDGRGGEDG